MGGSAGVKLGALEAVIAFAGEVGGRDDKMRYANRDYHRECDLDPSSRQSNVLFSVDSVKGAAQRSYDYLERHDFRRSKLHRSPPHLKISNPRANTFR
jgi:hypothetical protein